MTERPDKWEPKEHEREYYRHATTGELGWLVRREGKDCIRRDIVAHEMILPFTKTGWIREEHHYPLTRVMLAQVAFEADKKLCYFLQRQDKAKVSWLDLSEEQRIEFAEKGPKGKERQRLFQFVMEALKDAVRA